MQKYRLDVWMAGSNDWEGYGLHDSYEMAVEEGEKLVRFFGRAREFRITPVQIAEKVEEMNPKDINFNVNVEFTDSMDQSCPGEIHAKGFPADDPEAKREYEKAAKDFCIDNMGAFDK
ncbi:hypothetical protein FIS44_00060 [Escherichia coli]|uniref:hypothetical protein n=1 Tax=Escherichia coli TaxID=562 RepID=UPI00111946EC|nr:hypothetical protein [Escherichia coli]TNH65302.1 hypothetical protein FG869_06195 [Escherichia coli]TPD46386.1 hypothetical protein FIS44_00060 [Escherichia coli]